jgi:hypothetical protein
MPELLIDDFSGPESPLGARWEGLTDRVMGGESDMTVGIRSEDGLPHLAMGGRVSLENNGGFIQARLRLSGGGRPPFDASAYEGVRLVVRGGGDDYYLFLRTTANVLPWSFFLARVPVTEEWREVCLPWSSFEKGDFGAFFALNPARLASVAVAAYKKAFTAALDLRRISFY